MKSARLLKPLTVLVLGLGLCAAPACLYAAPANDNFASRIVLTGTTVSANGANASATAEALEPEHSAIPGAQTGSRRTVWWSWNVATASTVVISVTRTNGNFPAPMLAVYTGTSVGALTGVASNFSGVAQCRVVFTATAGTTYQMAVDDNGSTFDSGIQFRLNAQVVLPPVNDNFANRTTIPNSTLDTLGTFVGASRQASENTHGASNFPQTVWWTWTAPAGTLTNRVSIHADAVSHAPDVGLYTGTSFPLTAISGVSNVTFGMTRVLNFLAVPGTTYQIALAGRQADPAPNAASTNYGAFRLRFNASTLALVVTSRTGGTNDNFASPFYQTTLLTNGLRIENWGNATSRPVRVRLEASPGYSVQADNSAPAFPATSNLFLSATVTVAAAQSISLVATGRCPAPDNLGFNGQGLGWGAYLFLEEQVGTAWFVVDHQLAGFGVWPDVGGFAGPGGGVIRIDPQAGTGSLCIPRLSDIQISAPALITEGASNNLSATAFFNCPSNVTFTSTLWSNSHAGTLITTNGLLRAGSVTSNTTITVHCFFEYRGVLSNATRTLILSNLPSPFITNRVRLPNGHFQMSGTAVADRRHTLQASTNLCCASNWVTLMPTNFAATNGVWGFTDTNAPGRPQRFYRVRED